MKKITLLFLTLICVASLKAQNWQFNTEGDSEGWAGVGTATQVTIEDGLLKAVHDITADNEGPKIILTGLNLDAASYTSAVIYLKTVNWDGGGKQFRFFWGREDSPGLDGNKLITVGGITPDAENFQTINVNLAHAEWTGTITQIRMDLCMWNGKEVHVDYIELIGAGNQKNLTVNISGNGSVEVDGAAYSDVISVDEGTTLTLNAIADEGYKFDGWSGDLSSSNTSETITMDADKTVTATFSADDTPVGDISKWEFNTEGDAEGWAGVGTATQVTIEEGLLKAVHDISADNEGPKIIQTGLSLDAASYARAVINLKTVAWEGGGKQFRFFWGREDSPGLDGNKLITVGGITPDADNYQTIEVDLAHAQWTGTITQIRMDLCMWQGKEVHVDYIRLLKMPEVTVVSLAQVQIGDDIIANSSENGKLYLVPSATNAVIADIEVAAGTNVLDVTADVDASFSTNDLATGDYVIYAVSEDGILSAASKVITLTEVTVVTYSVTFIVNDGSSAIEGAVVTFDGQSFTTGSDGKAVITEVTAASYDYSISAAGFDDANGNVTVTDADVEETVTLNASAPTYTITFVVDNGSEVIEGALVTINSSSIATDAFGMAVFSDLEAGVYDYIVTANGFSDASGSVTVSDADVQETVSLAEFITNAVQWLFDNGTDTEGWVPNSELTTLEVKDGIMTAYSNEWHGPEIRIFGLNFMADDYPLIEVKIKTRIFAENEGKKFRVFWNDPAAERSVFYDYTANAEEFQVLEIDMSGHDLWTGPITDLRFDVCYGHGKEVDIDYIKMVGLTGVNLYNSDSFSLYPNPAEGFVQVKGSWTDRVNYRIFSVTGEVVLHGFISNMNERIYLRNINPGMYFISIDNRIEKLIVR